MSTIGAGDSVGNFELAVGDRDWLDGCIEVDGRNLKGGVIGRVDFVDGLETVE